MNLELPVGKLETRMDKAEKQLKAVTSKIDYLSKLVKEIIISLEEK